MKDSRHPASSDVSAIVERFAAVRRSAPARTLIYRPGLHSTLSASMIWDDHQRIADRLVALKAAPGQLVMSSLGNRAEAAALLLACRALGLPLMPVDAGVTAPEIQQLAARFGARILVAPRTGESATGMDAVECRLCHGEAASYPDTALLKLTSGSTGLPKAVVVSEAHVIADTIHITTTMEIGVEDAQIAVIPLSHAYGLSVLLLPLLFLGTPVVLRESFVPQQLPADARAAAARRLAGVPFMFDHFIAHPPADGWPPSLTRIISAGARLPPATAIGFHRQFGVKIHGFYGTTESGGICYDRSDAIDVGDRVGRPLNGVTLTLIPEPGIEPGAGRVHVRSAAVGRGYAGGESSDFVDGGFLTGDFGTLDREGLTLKGRVSSFINVAGRKVQPEEVETVLRRMPGITDVRVLGAADPRRGQQVAACVVASAARPSVVDIRQFCAQSLAPHKIPRLIVFVDAIPMTLRGKTDRVALEELIRAHTEGPL
jgi:long-chain acyl-CoA synthetase